MATTTRQSRTAAQKSASARPARLEIRVSARQKALIARAAACEGCSVTDFVVSAVTAAADSVIQEHELVRLNQLQSQTFVESLLNPAPPGAALRKAAREHKRTVESR